MQTDKIKLLHKRPRKSKRKKNPKSFYLNDYSSSPLPFVPRVTLIACMLRCLICVHSKFSWPYLSGSLQSWHLIYQGSWRIATRCSAFLNREQRGGVGDPQYRLTRARKRSRETLDFRSIECAGGEPMLWGSYGNPEKIPAFICSVGGTMTMTCCNE